MLEGVETDRARELLFSTGPTLYISYSSLHDERHKKKFITLGAVHKFVPPNAATVVSLYRYRYSTVQTVQYSSCLFGKLLIVRPFSKELGSNGKSPDTDILNTYGK